MDEEWEEITQQLKQETNPSVLQEYVDAPSPAVAASTTLTNQTIHAMFQQPYQQVQDELARQPNLSTQLLNEIDPTTVVMTMNETAEFEAELQSSGLLTQMLVTACVVADQDQQPSPSDARGSRRNESTPTRAAESEFPPGPTITIGSSCRSVQTAPDGAATPTRLVAQQPSLTKPIHPATI